MKEHKPRPLAKPTPPISTRSADGPGDLSSASEPLPASPVSQLRPPEMHDPELFPVRCIRWKHDVSFGNFVSGRTCATNQNVKIYLTPRYGWSVLLKVNGTEKVLPYTMVEWVELL